MTPTTFTCWSACAKASCGNGRKARTRTMPALTPLARSLSTVMRVVPAVEPTTTMATSASSRRYGSSRPYWRPLSSAYSSAMSWIHLEGAVHGAVLRHLVLEVPAVEAVERAHGHRVLGVQHRVGGAVRADELLDLVLGQHLQRPDGAADHVAVVHVHRGQAHVHRLGDAHRLDAVVVRLLVVLAVAVSY